LNPDRHERTITLKAMWLSHPNWSSSKEGLVAFFTVDMLTAGLNDQVVD